MVRGIEQFRKFFAGYEENYVIIGGTACEYHEEANALQPRATKDIDVILIVEALSHDFIRRFWEFIKAANYAHRNVGTTGSDEIRHEYYRFKKPQATDAEYPYQIELFSRKLKMIDIPDDAHITPIPTDEDLSSLSAILMDDDYYNFTIKHSIIEDGIHLANVECLICLKAKAFLELKARKANGEPADGRDIEKHKKDVFRLAAMLRPADRFNLPQSMMDDMSQFCKMASEEMPNEDFMKASGIRGISAEELLNIVRNTFKLSQ